jgi:hypothetical protein
VDGPDPPSGIKTWLGQQLLACLANGLGQLGQVLVLDQVGQVGQILVLGQVLALVPYLLAQAQAPYSCQQCINP